MVGSFKTDTSRCFAYLAQNHTRRGYRDTYQSPQFFSARQRRRMRHKARRHGEVLGYPQLEERWRRWNLWRRTMRTATTVESATITVGRRVITSAVNAALI